jgi:hypothetical protein
MKGLRWLLLTFALGGLMLVTALQGQTQTNHASTESAATARSSMTIPEGTEIAVRTNQAIDSTTASEGHTYSGTVEQDVTGPSGEVLIPKGSSADLVVRTVSSGGTTGSPNLALDLKSIDIGGHHYAVSTAELQQSNESGIGKNKRTGEYIGGGAALGTLLGAIAGGGKGAAIGAVAGAVAGGTTQVLTRGKEVKVPAETTLQFRLDRPLTLKETTP